MSSTQTQNPTKLTDGSLLYVTPLTNFEVSYACVGPNGKRRWDAYVSGAENELSQLRLIEYHDNNAVARTIQIERDFKRAGVGVVNVQQTPSADIKTIHVEHLHGSLFPDRITPQPTTDTKAILAIPEHCHRLVDRFFPRGM